MAEITPIEVGVRITEDPNAPVPQEVLADAIIKLSKAVQSLSQRSGLNRRAIVILIQHSPGMSNVRTGDIEAVLNSIERLERNYCAPGK